MSTCENIVALVRARLPEILALRDSFHAKEDGSYVSRGDFLVQSLVLDLVSRELPRHRLISEEMAPFGDTVWPESASYVILDPIDGTENFVSGLREWGVGVSIYAGGAHVESCIYLPELDDVQITGMPMRRFRSRIFGLSSSLSGADLTRVAGWPGGGMEFRIIGCSMYNTLAAARGSFAVFENVNGVNCWDILPGLNLALEHGCQVEVDGQPYAGGILFPTRKFKIKITAPGASHA